MNRAILKKLINEVNLGDSLVTVDFINGNSSINNICVDTSVFENDSLIFTGQRSAFIDRLSLRIDEISNVKIIFDKNNMCYSLIQKDNRLDFHIHT